MDKIYIKLWQLSKPYYEKGRIYDIDQIEWMMKIIDEIIDKIDVDKKILIPLVILHDVGYSTIENKNPNIKDKESKRIHMAEGAKIAKKILEQANYDQELSKKIIELIKVHDNWVFGDHKTFKQNKELAFFNDLDFLFSQSSYKSLEQEGKSMGKTPKQMYELWLTDEKHANRPFSCKQTQKLFTEQMKQRKKEVN